MGVAHLNLVIVYQKSARILLLLILRPEMRVRKMILKFQYTTVAQNQWRWRARSIGFLLMGIEYQFLLLLGVEGSQVAGLSKLLQEKIISLPAANIN